MHADSHPAPDAARIGDAERERAATRLRDHVGTGRLDLADFEHRVGLLYAATTRSDLAAAFVDLPAAAPERAPANASRSGRSHYLLLQLTAFWGPFALTCAISLTVWLAVSLATGRATNFWPLWVIAPWGLTLALGDMWWWGPPLRRSTRRRARRRAAGRLEAQYLRSATTNA